jgi:hypothetical protein
MRERFRAGASHAQAQAEYILLIGLIILFIIVVLLQFRDSVNGYTSKVIAWLDGSALPASAPPSGPVTPPAPSPKPTPTLTPTPTPMSAEDWSKWLVGKWCGASDWTGGRTAPGVVNGMPVTALGGERFRFTNPANPNDFTDYERLPGGTFRMTYRNLTPSLSPSAPWRRC